jgi:hypothetical protein
MRPTGLSQVFFACDTGSKYFVPLRSAFEELTQRNGLGLLVFDQQLQDAEGILDKVKRLIAESVCLVADVGTDTTRSLNPNVMLEVGLAVAIAKPVLLICAEPRALPSNLQGRDAVKYPDCCQIGCAQNQQVQFFFEQLGRNLLGGRDVRIFPSRSREYLEILRRINMLPGDEWYVAPELRSFLRPPEAEIRWLKEARRVTEAHLKQEQTRREERKAAFLANLAEYICIDIYPKSGLELRTWRDMALTSAERTGFLRNALELLDRFSNYHIFLLEEEEKQKYWIKLAELSSFVVFEGWGYVDIRRQKPAGGLILSEAATVQDFLKETENIAETALFDRTETVAYIKSQLG